jgi:hypothetical protein
MASLSDITSPPESHPLCRNFCIDNTQKTKTIITTDNNSSLIANPPAHVSRTITDKPLALEYNSNTSTVYGKPALPPKPQLTEEEKKERNEEAERKLKEELALVIIDKTVDEINEKDIDDLQVIQKEFEIIHIPNEMGTGIRTFIHNYREFEELTNNSFILPMIFMSVMLETTYQKIDTVEEGVMWAFNRECTQDEVEQAKYQYIDDIVMCTDCNAFNSTIAKNSHDELIRICASSNCRSVRVIEYTKSDDDAENISRQFMMSEILENVVLYSPITVQMEKIDSLEPIKEPSEEKIKLCKHMQDIIDGKIDPPLYEPRSWNHGSVYNSGRYSSSWQGPIYGIGRGSRPANHVVHVPSNVHVPTGFSTSTKATGYGVSRYGNHFSQPSVVATNNSGISSGYVQSLSQAKKQFGLQEEDDDRKFFTYTNSKKDKFQAYLRFLIQKITDQSTILEKEPYGKSSTTTENFWGLAPVVLLNKARELDCIDVAVMANVMYLFDENIIKSNQLINKRKYLLPFINSAIAISESIGVFFLIGLEYLIENNENELMTSVEQIMTIGMQQKYFDMEAFDKWMAIENNYITTQDFSTRLRRNLVSWRGETDNASNEGQFSNAVSTDVSDDEVDDDGFTNGTPLKFNTNLFADINDDELQTELTNDSLPSYDESISVKKDIIKDSFVFNPKTLVIENVTKSPFIVVD